MPHSHFAAALAFGLLLLIAPAAQAAPVTPPTKRYASPSPTGGPPCTNPAAPCSLADALAAAVGGNEVVMAPGTYAGPVTIDKAIVVRGTPGLAKPRIQTSSAPTAVDLQAGLLNFISISAAGGGAGATALRINDGAMARRVIVTHASSSAGAAVLIDDGGTLRDSVAYRAGGSGGSVVSVANGSTYLYNVTAYAGTNAVVPLYITATKAGQTALARNVIARRTPPPFGTPGPAIQVSGACPFQAVLQVGQSNFNGAAPASGCSSIENLGGNQSAAPGFVSAAGGNFHQTSTSPTLDAGFTGGAIAGTDVDGDQRVVGPNADIGADERTPVPTATTTAATNVGSTVARLPGTITPNGGFTSYAFEYGKTTSYELTPTLTYTPLNNSFGGQSVNRKITGLEPGTTYHFRVRALNATGASNGADMTFTTGAVGTPDPGGPGPDPAGDGPGPDSDAGAGGGPGAPGARPGPGGPVATLAPALGVVRVTNPVFAVAAAPTPLVAVRRRKAPRGTTIVFNLSMGAEVRIAVQRALAGRRTGRICVKPSRKLRKARKCTRWQTAGTLVRQGKQGANTVAFTGRLGKKALASGKYRFSLYATVGGKRSATRTVAFRIVRK